MTLWEQKYIDAADACTAKAEKKFIMRPAALHVASLVASDTITKEGQEYRDFVFNDLKHETLYNAYQKAFERFYYLSLEIRNQLAFWRSKQKISYLDNDVVACNEIQDKLNAIYADLEVQGLVYTESFLNNEQLNLAYS